MTDVWILNTLPSHWEICERGPKDPGAHGDHVDKPWHGLPENSNPPNPEKMEKGDILLIRQTSSPNKRYGVKGIWILEDYSRVRSQEHVPDEWRKHGDEERDYDWFLYCKASTKELDHIYKEDWEALNVYPWKLAGTAVKLEEEEKNNYLEALLDHGGLSNETQALFREELGYEQWNEKINQEEAVPDIEVPETQRTETKINRVIRDTELVNKLKKLHNYKCQICEQKRKKDSDKNYAEGHHLKPLGEPHEGPDVKENILILCPNHHTDFDYGMIEIDPETLEIKHEYEKELNGKKLKTKKDHQINQQYLKYHGKKISKIE